MNRPFNRGRGWQRGGHNSRFQGGGRGRPNHHVPNGMPPPREASGQYQPNALPPHLMDVMLNDFNRFRNDFPQQNVMSDFPVHVQDGGNYMNDVPHPGFQGSGPSWNNDLHSSWVADPSYKEIGRPDISFQNQQGFFGARNFENDYDKMPVPSLLRNNESSTFHLKDRSFDSNRQPTEVPRNAHDRSEAGGGDGFIPSFSSTNMDNFRNIPGDTKSDITKSAETSNLQLDKKVENLPALPTNISYDEQDAIQRRNAEMRRQFELLLAEEKAGLQRRRGDDIVKQSEDGKLPTNIKEPDDVKPAETFGENKKLPADSPHKNPDTSAVGNSSLGLKSAAPDVLPPRSDVDLDYLEKRNAEMRREFLRLMDEENMRRRNSIGGSDDKPKEKSKDSSKSRRSSTDTQRRSLDNRRRSLDRRRHRSKSKERKDSSLKDRKERQEISREKTLNQNADSKKGDEKSVNKEIESKPERSEKQEKSQEDKSKVDDKSRKSNTKTDKSDSKTTSHSDRSKDSEDHRKKSTERSRKNDSLDTRRSRHSPGKDDSKDKDNDKDNSKDNDNSKDKDNSSVKKESGKDINRRSQRRRSRSPIKSDKRSRSKDNGRSKSLERGRKNDRNNTLTGRKTFDKDNSKRRSSQFDNKKRPLTRDRRSLSPVRRKIEKRNEPKVPAIEQLRRELDQEARNMGFDDMDKSEYYSQQPSSTIIIRCLALSLTEDDIALEFKKCNVQPLGIRLIRNRMSGTSRGFAFVDFATVDLAKEWMEAKQGRMVFQNRYLATLQYSPSDWNCEKCLSFNFRKRDSCFKCGDYRYKEKDIDENEISTTPTDALVLKNLDTLTTKESILAALQKGKSSFLSNIKNIYIGVDGLTNTSNGTAYIEMTDVQNATMFYNVCQEMGLQIDGRSVMVSFLKKKSADQKSGCVISAPAIHRYKKEDIPTLAEYSASLYAKTPQEKTTYVQYYKDYYEKLLIKGEDLILPKQNQTDAVNAAAAVAQWAIQRVVASGTSRNFAGQQANASKPKSSIFQIVTFDPTKKYPPPDGTKFEYDESLGYYFDRTTGLYYDANSQYFMCPESKKILCFDPYQSMYVSPAEYAQSVEFYATAKKDDKELKNEAAKKVVKEMEKWAKTLKHTKDDSQKSSLLNSQPVKKKGTADVGYAVLEREELKSNASSFHLKNVPHYVPQKDEGVFVRPQSLSSKGPESSKQGLSFSLKNASTKPQSLAPLVQYGSDSDEEDETQQQEETYAAVPSQQIADEDKFFDYKKFLCLLCKRRFQNQDILVKHRLYSDLHRDNLAKHHIQESKKKLYML